MRLYTNWPQKLIALAAMAIAFLTFSFAPVNADETPGTDTSTCTDSTSCLQYITKNTYDILQKVNSLPDFFTTITTYFDNLIAGDTSDTTAQMQTTFAGIGNDILNVHNTLNADTNLIKLAADNIHAPVSDFSSTSGETPAVLGKFPQINDVTYSTMIGKPPVTRGASTDPYNYLKNAAGLNYPHVQPTPAWQTRTLPKYQAYFDTIMAVQSFNSYVLDRIVAETNNGSQFTTLQNNLISQASNANWFTTVGSEEIGKVIRQILLFQSQTFILMTQLIQTEKQILTAAVMANTLQIQVNQDKESQLANKAQGITPGA